MIHPEISDFYYMFSRLEYALKASGFLMGGENVKVDWDAFANNIAPHFNQNQSNELRESIEFLKTHPPRKQIIQDGMLTWRQTNNDNLPLINYLLLMVRRIRNNLFHGGKLQSGYTVDVSRDLRLICSAIIILKEAININDSVSHYFKQPISE